MKCAWHGAEDCPVRRTEEAVREYLHYHENGRCDTNCYGCFLINEAMADVEAERNKLNLQNGELKQALVAMVSHPKLYPNTGDWRIAQAQKALGDETTTLKRVAPVQNCNHVPDHNPETGRTYCERCGTTL